MNARLRKPSLLIGALLFLRTPRLFAEPSHASLAAFNAYARAVESRLAEQHRSPNAFLLFAPDARARLRSGELLIEHLSTPITPDALIHHWRASAFLPGATPAEFEHLLQDFSAYPHNFAPQVVSSTVLSRTGIPNERSGFDGAAAPTDTLIRIRTRQHHIITVVLDTTCDVTVTNLDPAHGYSISRSTRIDEITPAGDNGFLYRLNTYWSYEQRDGGLYLQLESLSLTRAIPRGLAWAIRPYVESVPRESIVFTLTSARNALRTNQ